MNSNLEIEKAIAVDEAREAKARLADIKLGCEMMLQPAVKPTGSFLAFINEVLRVASAPL